MTRRHTSLVGIAVVLCALSALGCGGGDDAAGGFGWGDDPQGQAGAVGRELPGERRADPAQPAACDPSCAGDTPHCNVATLTCECTSASCPAGKACEGGACVSQVKPCTVEDAAAAASAALVTMKSEKKLPEGVTVCSKTLSAASFLALSAAAVVEIADGTMGALDPKDFAAASNPKDTTVKGSVPKAEYVDLAVRVKKFMDANGQAPNYASDTSLGAYMGFTNLVVLFSSVLDGYRTSGQLPGSVALELFSPETTNPLSPVAGYAQINLTSDWGSCGSHSGGVSIAFLRGLTTNGEAEQVESDIYWKYGGRVYGGPGRSTLAEAFNAYMAAKGVGYQAFLFSDGDAVKGLIDAGTPVVAHTVQWGGHYVAIYGLVDEGGTMKVYFSDGASSDGVSASLPTGYLKKWNWSTLRSYIKSGYIGFKRT